VEAAVHPSSNGVRVLIADDNPLFVEMIDAMLTAEGMKVVGRAQDGQEAFEQTLALDPDVTLMDISMPVMDGIEATRLIRERRPDACVLVLTGSKAMSDVDRARKAGAAAFLSKDHIASELITTISELAAR
jgi:two-component system, NarL family, nitrate/nitrite response regulator NarL